MKTWRAGRADRPGRIGRTAAGLSAAALTFLTMDLAAAQTATPGSATNSETVIEAIEGERVSVSLSSGVDYSAGDYGAADKTKILVVPMSLRVGRGPLRLSATLPYLRIDSPGNIVGGGAGGPIIIDPNAPATRTVRKGLGDLSIGGTYTVPTQILGFDLDLSGRIKLPTSSKRKSLGTGKTDYQIRGELSRQFGTWTPFASVGYRFLGDPAGVDLRNSVSTSIGTTKLVGSTVFIASYDYARATTDAVEDAHELFGAVSGRLTKSLNWTTYGVAGLSEGSADYGIGLLVTLRLQ